MRRWISCVRPPIRPWPTRGRPLGGGTRQHRVLGRHPADPLAAQCSGRDRRSSPRRAPPCPRPGSGRTLGPLLDAERDRHGPQVVRPSVRRAKVAGLVADLMSDLSLRLGRIPQLIERREIEVAQRDTPVGRLPLDARESTAELRVRGTDRGLGLDPALRATLTSTNSRSPNSSAGPWRRVGGAAQLVDLLGDLVEHAVEPTASRSRGWRPVPASPGWRRAPAATGRSPSSEPRAGAPASAGSAGRGRRASARSSALIRSHWRLTSDAVRATASPNTWGWRRTIFVAIAAWTSARSKTPASAASCAWRTTWSHRSPTSPASAGVAPPRVRRRPRTPPRAGACAARVRLLAIPRAAVGRAQAGEIQGMAQGPATAALGRHAAAGTAAPQIGGSRSPTVVASADPNRPRVPGG